WLDENGNKFPEMNSEWIELGFVTGNGWSIDTSSSTEERTVLYYADPIAPGEETTEFLDSITINDVILTKVSQSTSVENGVTVIRTSFIYNGKQFCLEVIADSVQDHNADQAKRSAWGVNNK
ncbi:MAG: hypothetical protein II739_08545, partial [Clostridia bacterium]|nr:hypothetical protein [Clostridia bacterium]